jgi:hypothetical protein
MISTLKTEKENSIGISCRKWEQQSSARNTAAANRAEDSKHELDDSD